MTEKTIESYLRDQVKAMGGIAFKFVSPGNDGVPDRLVLLPGKRVFFVEMKAPGKTSRPLQIMQQKRISDLGFIVFKDIDSREDVDAILIGYGRDRK